jgi:hypothetical protein
VQFRPAHRIASHTQRRRLAEENVFQRRQCRLRSQYTQHNTRSILLHEDGSRKDVQGTRSKQQIVTVADHLGRQVVKVRLQHPDAIALFRAFSTADEDAEEVGLFDELAPPRSVADAFHRHDGLLDPLCTMVVRMAAPVGVAVSSALIGEERAGRP